MIELSALMWTFGMFFAIIGFLRGWNRELVASAGIVLGVFAIFQFDGFLRGILFTAIPRTQVFLLQAVAFVAIVFLVYQAKDFSGVQRRDERDLQAGLLGAAVGFINGYLIGGSLWYLLDINEYPFDAMILAPAANSPSAQSIGWMPLMLLGGGASGTGDLLAVLVLVLLFVVLVVI